MIPSAKATQPGSRMRRSGSAVTTASPATTVRPMGVNDRRRRRESSLPLLHPTAVGLPEQWDPTERLDQRGVATERLAPTGAFGEQRADRDDFATGGPQQ